MAYINGKEILFSTRVGGSSKLPSLIDRSVTEITAEDMGDITEIGQYAFYGCNKLVRFEMPTSVTKTGKYAFSLCSSLEIVNITDLGAWCNITHNDTSANPLGATTKAKLYLNNAIVSGNIVVPSTATQTALHCFWRQSQITGVTFEGDITSIANGLVGYCDALEYVDFSSCTSVPTLANKNAFSSVPTTCKVIVPDSLYSSWIAATNWASLSVTFVKASEV